MKTLLTLLAGLAVSLSSLPAQDTPPAGRLRVVTSFLPMQSHAAAIAGDRADVIQLLDKETGPHDFQLTPGDVRKLADADLFVINGVGLEDWLDKLVAQAGNKNLKVVDTSQGITLLESPEAVFDRHGHSHGHDHHGHDHGGGPNPHVWLDPVLAKEQAGAILQALIAADPANRSAYKANAAAYFQKLDALDSDFRSAISALRNRNLVTFHDAFPYLAKRYGLNYVGYVEEFPEKDPSPKQLAALVQKIREIQVGVIFAEEGYTPNLLERIAEQTGARVSALDTLEVGVGSPTAYIERMQKNLAAMQGAFSANR
ncbi:MAG: metal ABC transporter substrate-binding protein [Terrimicrobiaceae bacterium]